MRLAGSRNNLRCATRERFSGFHHTIAMILPTGGAGRTVQIDPLQADDADEYDAMDFSATDTQFAERAVALLG
jgi:hypothetical protein